MFSAWVVPFSTQTVAPSSAATEVIAL